MICLTLGRPSSIVRNDIIVPYPENQPFLSELVKLANIMSDAAQSIYAYKQSSLLDMCRKAQKIHQELRNYAFGVQERLGISMSGSSESNGLDIKEIILHNSKGLNILWQVLATNAV